MNKYKVTRTRRSKFYEYECVDVKTGRIVGTRRSHRGDYVACVVVTVAGNNEPFVISWHGRSNLKISARVRRVYDSAELVRMED